MILAWLAFSGPLAPAAEVPIAWHTGSGLTKQLAQPVGVYWSDNPLRQAVDGLSHAHRVAVLIDRRVDPGQTLDLAVTDVPLEQVLEEIARSRSLGVCSVGPVTYLGPPPVTSRLPTLAELRREEARGLPSGKGRKFLLSKRIGWDDFATPRDLLRELAADNGIELLGSDRVPHDLWAAADLPPLPLADRLTLIAGQFDLTFQIAADGQTVTLVPVPDDVAIVRSYPGGRQPEQLAAKWAALLPNCRIKVVNGKIYVRGLLEDHARITASGPTPRHPATGPGHPVTGPGHPVTGPGHPATGPGHPAQGETRFTVRDGQGSLGEVLQQLAARLQMQLEIDRAGLERAGISLQEQVSFSVKDATLDELFEAVLAPAGCTFRREGNTIRVGPAR